MSAHKIGVIFDHGCRSAEGLSVDIIEYAKQVGFDAGEDYNGHKRPWLNKLRSEGEEDRGQMLYDLSEQAIDYLNSLDLPPYTYYANDGEAGAFGLWASVESLNSDMASVPSYMMHVNDHGNVTLYAVELKEIWSVV